MSKFNCIAFKVAAGLFLCQALYNFVTELTQEAYLDQLQMSLMFFILSQFYETKKQNKSG